MTVQLKNQKEKLNDFPLLRKIVMVTSNRDGRIGFIIKATDKIVTLKLEGLDTRYDFDFETFINGFSFSYTKEELVEQTYKIKSLKRVCPRLNNLDDVYISSNLIYDYLSRYFDNLTNFEVYQILANLKKKFENN